jgi:hypothetical protein
MRYEIIAAGDTEHLAKLVSERLAKGWKPQGGICSYIIYERDEYGNEHHYPWFAQTVTYDQ